MLTSEFIVGELKRQLAFYRAQLHGLDEPGERHFLRLNIRITKQRLRLMHRLGPTPPHLMSSGAQ